MNLLSNKFNTIKNLNCKILLQIHDELIFEVKKNEVSKYEELIKKERSKKEKIEKVEKDGFLIGKKLLTKRDTRTCPVCDTYSFDIKDDVYMNKHECCYKCFIQYVERNPERWKSGWRPNIGDK